MASRFNVQHLATKPAGWRVRSRKAGEHVVRIAFPPGARRRGSGKVLEVLHPRANAACEEGSCSARSNPAELVVFTNPSAAPTQAGAKKGTNNHKPGCNCPFCKRARDKSAHPSQSLRARKNPPTPEQRQRTKATRERASRIRAARLTRTNSRRAIRNPSSTEQAVKLFENFSGREASEVIEAQRSAAMRLDYAALGKLVAIGFDDCGIPDSKLMNHWDECAHLPFEGNAVMLASAPAGSDKKAKQLYFIEGNQNLDAALADFEGIDTGKDLIDLGDVFFVVYEARKAHNKFEPTDWCHRFGRKTGILPRLAYDKLKKEMTLIGGAYFIDLSTDLSPGIEG